MSIIRNSFRRLAAVSFRASAAVAGLALAMSPLALQAQNILFTEGFEGVWPGAPWTVGDANTNGSAAYWDDVSSSFGGEGTAVGSWKGYCAGTGYAGTTANPVYTNYMAAFMQRPVNLTGYSRARLTFYYKIPFIESCCDSANVLMDGTNVWKQTVPQSNFWAQAQVDLNAYAGGSHALRFEFDSDQSVNYEGWYVDEIQLVLPPVNDDFTNATIITGNSNIINGTTIFASLEPGETQGYPDIGAVGTVWYRWTAPTNGCYTFTVPRYGSIDAVVHVFTGITLSNLTELNGDFGYPFGEAQVTIRAQTGVTYSIRVGGFFGSNFIPEANFTLVWNPATNAPVNDNFSSAITLFTSSGAAYGNNCLATSEVGEPDSPANSVWWAWIAPSNGCFYFNTAGSDFDTLLGLYTGATVGALTVIGRNDDYSDFSLQSQVAFAGVSNTTYRVRVSGFGLAEGNIQLNWGALPVPPNDNLSNAIPVFTQTFYLNGYNCGATFQAGEPAAVYPSATNTVWWKWTCPANGRYQLSSAGSTFTSDLCVFTGDSISNLVSVGCGSPWVWTCANAGVDYYLRVAGSGGASGTINVSSFRDPVVNDAFTNAFAFTNISGTTNGFTCGATGQPGEPLPSFGATNHSVWVKWVPLLSGCMEADTVGSTFDTVLSVYSGTAITNLVLLGANDDWPGLGYQSRVEFSVSSGESYWIRVDGYNGAEGDYVVNWGADITPPANDKFTGAVNLVGSYGNFAGNNCGATPELGEPADHAPTKTVWFRWVAPATASLAFDTVGSSLDTRLWVFQGTSLSDLVQLGFNDDTFGFGLASRVVISTTAGVTNWIRLDGFGGNSGDYLLNWGCPPQALTALKAGTNYVLSWPATGYRLQASPVIGVGASWTNVPGLSPITVPISGASLFYRLSCP